MHPKHKYHKYHCALGRLKKNYIQNLFLIQNRIRKVIQLLKPGKFSPLNGFEGGFPFCENLKRIISNSF